MPVIPSSGVLTTTGISTSYRDAYGRARATAFALPSAATQAQVDTIQEQSGNLSNAAIYQNKFARSLEVTNFTDLVTLDELFDMSSSLVLVYRNSLTARVSYYEVPSPDASVATLGGQINYANTTLIALDVAIRAAAPLLVLTRAYIATRKVAKIGNNVPLLPAPIEPSGLILPPAAPASGL